MKVTCESHKFQKQIKLISTKIIKVCSKHYLSLWVDIRSPWHQYLSIPSSFPVGLFLVLPLLSLLPSFLSSSSWFSSSFFSSLFLLLLLPSSCPQTSSSDATSTTRPTVKGRPLSLVEWLYTPDSSPIDTSTSSLCLVDTSIVSPSHRISVPMFGRNDRLPLRDTFFCRGYVRKR